MFDKYTICEEGFRNVVRDGEVVGFELSIRIAYYRGLRLSMVEGFEVTADGETFPVERNLFTAGGRSYSYEEMEREPTGRWEFGEKAVLFVPRPGGLAPGPHTHSRHPEAKNLLLPNDGGWRRHQDSCHRAVKKGSDTLQLPDDVDVLIVGSGPVGCTFARELTRSLPKSRILLVDAGPRLTPRAGMHVKNITDPAERTRAQILSQGPTAYAYDVPTLKQRSESAGSGPSRSSVLARAGTFLLDYQQDGRAAQMPAVAMSTNVGGMGAHWTCACPRPGNTERIPFIPETEWNQLCTRAEGLLRVTRNAYPKQPPRGRSSAHWARFSIPACPKIARSEPCLLRAR